MGRTNWKTLWKHRVKPTRFPGIWKMQEGGHIARARVTDPTTGKVRELKKVLPEGSAHDAFIWLEARRQNIRDGVLLAQPRRMRFADFAVSAFERKVKKNELKSAATQSKWQDILVHLIGGTRDAAGESPIMVSNMALCLLPRALFIPATSAWPRSAKNSAINSSTMRPRAMVSARRPASNCPDRHVESFVLCDAGTDTVCDAYRSARKSQLPLYS